MKKIITKRRVAMVLAAALTIGAVLALCERRGITSLTGYLAGMHAGAEPAVPQDPPAEGTADPAVQPGGVSGEKGDDAGGVLVSSDKDDTPTALGTLVPGTVQQVDEPGGVVSRTQVDLPQEALAWTTPGKYPSVGELLSIGMPSGRTYVFQVISFEQLPEGRGLVVLAELQNGHGKVNMMFYTDHFSMQLVDREAKRSYSVFYDVRDNHYTVEEADMTKVHATLAP